eukprot:CAMPEP_0170418462 /NCGR_PEP_ID=MMETSP0117_2-20130122/34275_1 /TAXON_ID=400756 /ORGANISM="Durinskia baltica, Strain CSIRO CS-38" /LENGTH=124 /DNA_ID=CAMNT_0010676741 /DNA_START=36 /DNA_END=410 /DNA_ORIENTATION=+
MPAETSARVLRRIGQRPVKRNGTHMQVPPNVGAWWLGRLRVISMRDCAELARRSEEQEARTGKRRLLRQLQVLLPKLEGHRREDVAAIGAELVGAEPALQHMHRVHIEPRVAQLAPHVLVRPVD